MSRRKILFTGGSGFIGHNVIPVLRESFDVIAPARKELNILDADAVERFVSSGDFYAIIHAANPNGVKNPLDKDVNMVEGSLRAFMNIYRVRSRVEKVLYAGSGAELDKSKDMMMIREEDFDRSVPGDQYGFAKYVMNTLAQQSENVINMRIFGCYGPGDHYSKFITHCINCLKAGQEITIRQDCYFDYMQVTDLAQIMAFMIDHDMRHHSYNVCSGKPVRLSGIAREVIKVYSDTVEKCDQDVKILSSGMNRSYCADNSRLMKEVGDYDFISLDHGIRMQIASMVNDPVIP